MPVSKYFSKIFPASSAAFIATSSSGDLFSMLIKFFYASYMSFVISKFSSQKQLDGKFNFIFREKPRTQGQNISIIVSTRQLHYLKRILALCAIDVNVIWW